MQENLFDLEESFKDKVKRFFSALWFPLLKFLLISGLLFYFKINAKTILSNQFELTHEKDKATLIWENFQHNKEELSLSIKKIVDYIGSASSGALAEAKIYSLEKMISLFSSLIELGITLFWVYLIFSFFSNVAQEYNKKDEQNEIANLVVKKILPILKKD